MHCWSGNVDIKYWKRQYQTEKNSGQNSGRSITKQRGRLPDTARAQVVPSSQLNFFEWGAQVRVRRLRGRLSPPCCRGVVVVITEKEAARALRTDGHPAFCTSPIFSASCQHSSDFLWRKWESDLKDSILVKFQCAVAQPVRPSFAWTFH